LSQKYNHERAACKRLSKKSPLMEVVDGQYQYASDDAIPRNVGEVSEAGEDAIPRIVGEESEAGVIHEAVEGQHQYENIGEASEAGITHEPLEDQALLLMGSLVK